MVLSTRVKLAVTAWVLLEILAFSLVAHWIGVPRAVLLGVITSLLGLTLLRRAGTSALMKLRGRLAGSTTGEGNRVGFVDELLASVGALALLLPGFLSDLVGLALAAPVLRERVARWIGRGGGDWLRAGRGTRNGPTTIDLDPDDWRRSDPAPGPITKTWSP